MIYLQVDIREDPVTNLSNADTSAAPSIRNTTSIIINAFQSGEMQERWRNHSATNGSAPSTLMIQEPFNNTNVPLLVISRVVLVTPPSSCRQHSPCDVQPVLVAYDDSGNVIDKLGSNDQPWQVEASIVGGSGAQVVGGIANYSDGQTQYTRFGVTALGTYAFEFRFVTPYGVSK